MKHASPGYTFIFILSILIIGYVSCKKESFIKDANALLFTSADTLHFDTVFTTAGSITQSFKIFNLNDQKLRISRLELSGGNNSAFKINANGVPGNSFTDLDIAANDSIYIFVSVTIDPQTPRLPFIVQDSILIEYNNNHKYVQLDAYGQNANFLRNKAITKDTAWNNELPFVIIGSLTVNPGATLSVHKGVRIYCHADAPILINGGLQTTGEKLDSNRVIFTGDRLDDDYRDLPGSWPGIFFSSTSTNNVLQYTTIKNALQGIIIESSSPNPGAKILLQQCIINNILDAGIISTNSSIRAENCLISNCGAGNINILGGKYDFIHCTVVSYSNLLLNHTSPVLSVTDANEEGQAFSMDANFINCIFYGESGLFDDELDIRKQGPDFMVNFENVLYKSAGNPLASFLNSIQNQDPQFANIDVEQNLFDFHLQPSSPCVDAGKNMGIDIDLDGNNRNISVNSPDIGCYEVQ